MAKQKDNKSINVATCFSAVVTTAGSTSTSEAYDMSYDAGYYSLQLAITGNGILTIDALYSNDASNFLVPQGATPIATGLTKTSGPGADGKVFLNIKSQAALARMMKIRLTETGGASTVTVTGYLASL